MIVTLRRIEIEQLQKGIYHARFLRIKIKKCDSRAQQLFFSVSVGNFCLKTYLYIFLGNGMVNMDHVSTTT